MNDSAYVHVICMASQQHTNGTHTQKRLANKYVLGKVRRLVDDMLELRKRQSAIVVQVRFDQDVLHQELQVGLRQPVVRSNQSVDHLHQVAAAEHVVAVKVCTTITSHPTCFGHFTFNTRTENPERMLRLYRLWRRIAKHRHHVQEILERAVAVLAGAEHLADSIAKRIDAQLRILEDLVHRQLGVLVVAHLLRGQLLEFLVRPADGVNLVSIDSSNHWCKQTHSRISFFVKNVRSS